jgi:hypothetical protein
LCWRIFRGSRRGESSQKGSGCEWQGLQDIPASHRHGDSLNGYPDEF